mgnify:CR=1 FL=1
MPVGLCPHGQRRPRPLAVSPAGPGAFGAHPRWSEARGPAGPQASTRLVEAPKSSWLLDAGIPRHSLARIDHEPDAERPDSRWDDCLLAEETGLRGNLALLSYARAIVGLVSGLFRLNRAGSINGPEPVLVTIASTGPRPGWLRRPSLQITPCHGESLLVRTSAGELEVDTPARQTDTSGDLEESQTDGADSGFGQRCAGQSLGLHA